MKMPNITNHHRNANKIYNAGGFPGGSVVKNLPANAEIQALSLIWEDPNMLQGTKPMCHNY